MLQSTESSRDGSRSSRAMAEATSWSREGEVERVSVPLKGNLWKGPFHLPRMQWYCSAICERLLAGEGGEGALRPIAF